MQTQQQNTWGQFAAGVAMGVAGVMAVWMLISGVQAPQTVQAYQTVVRPVSLPTATVPYARMPAGASAPRHPSVISVRAEEEPQEKEYIVPKNAPAPKSTEFGYSRKDVTIITFGLVAVGYAFYYALQAFGVSEESAGTTTMIVSNVGLLVGWVGSYVGRVASKDMTYAKQLKDYEAKVMAKRYEEMTDEELQALAEAPEEPASRDDNTAEAIRRWM